MENGKQPAFAAVCDNTNPYLQEGLTKREIFAMSAMQGILSNPNTANAITTEFGKVNAIKANEIIAATSLNLANALLKALEE